MRLACDIGGTFTDLMVEDAGGAIRMYKAQTTPYDPVQGLIDAASLAAQADSASLAEFLGRCDLLIHGTTHAINAIVTGRTARTAFLTTAGHPDILLLREGGRQEPFNFLVPYPEPYVPRALTFEVAERVNAAGETLIPLDDAQVIGVLDRLSGLGVEAICVSLLWAIANPEHELRIGRLIEARLPAVPYTLAHQLNPTLREYRRASASAIDASLKPLMGRYLGGLTSRLAQAGFKGRTLVLTSQGGMMEAGELARQPIHAINSGPSMAPIAGRHYAALDAALPAAIIADTGGTTYDVSLVRYGRIPKTRETWIGQPFRGHMTGFPSIDIKSIGAGGGSIARVDTGGMLHVGPQSAGAIPGPVCYATGGTQPTLTDACLVLGWLDANFFLGGRMRLDLAGARRAIEEQIAHPLKLDPMQAAIAIVNVATENMVQAIAEITINQGIDPAEAVLVGGGGAAGFNSVWIARRLRCPLLIVPETGAALSAAGALMSELRDEYREMFFTTSESWNAEGVNAVLARLAERCRAFAQRAGGGEHRMEFAVEARYAGQVWEIEIPLRTGRFDGVDGLDALVRDFHDQHEQIFAVRDPGSAVEFVGWTAAVTYALRRDAQIRLSLAPHAQGIGKRRPAYFEDTGLVDTPIYGLEALPIDQVRRGPAIIETPFTTTVIDSLATYWQSRSGSLIIKP